MKMKCLLIGDMHIKKENVIESSIFKEEILKIIKDTKPNLVVVLGDILHSFERVNTLCLNRATDILRSIQEISDHLVIIIGNHDYINNNQFLTDMHPFNMCKLWDKTTVVDDVTVLKFNSDFKLSETEEIRKFLFIPYVHVGRLEEAIKSKGLDINDLEFNGVFTHQEYDLSKMNGLSKKKGDKWILSNPICYSGHEHDYEIVQDNLRYVGACIESTTRVVCLVEYLDTGFLEKKIKLKIPERINVTLTPEELSSFQVEEDFISLKIIVKGNHDIISKVMKLKHVKEIINMDNVQVKIIDTTIENYVIKEANTQIPFYNRLITEIKKRSKDLIEVFENRICC